MNILIAKVGSIRSNEIKVLAGELNKKHKVTVCCMAAESSYRGLAFSYVGTPIRVFPVYYKDVVKNSTWVAQRDVKSLKAAAPKVEAFDDIAAYEIMGQPADATSIMLSEIMGHKKPDLVICGISNGAHMGQHVYTSSNIGMAMESCMLGAPTIAVGVAEKVGGYTEEELKPVAEFIGKNVEKFVKMKLPNHTFLNINVPLVTKYKDIKGIKVCNLSRLILPCSYVEKTDPSGGKYYWTDRSAIKNDLMGEEFARTWYDRGYITIVPINYDATDFECVARWNESVLKDIKKGRKKA